MSMANSDTSIFLRLSLLNDVQYIHNAALVVFFNEYAGDA